MMTTMTMTTELSVVSLVRLRICSLFTYELSSSWCLPSDWALLLIYIPTVCVQSHRHFLGHEMDGHFATGVWSRARPKNIKNLGLIGVCL